MSPSAAAIAIVGMGPRGISVVERIAAALAGHPPAELTLHLIEPSELGAGEIWRTDQTRTLCMNTLAGAVTLFTEPGASVTAPVVEGPIQYDWIRLVRGDRGGVPAPAAQLFDRFPPADDTLERFRAEITETRPESNPSRALYGEYLRWAYDTALALLPDWVQVQTHQASVVDVIAGDSADVLTLDDGTELSVEQTVLAPGWLRPADSAEEESFSRSMEEHPELTWIRPANPLAQNLADIPAGEDVLVRGLGMGFFDVMALCTLDRGGRFVPDDSARSGLRYEPSGNEPHFLITSGRGYPYLPKSDYHSLPPAARLVRFREVAARISAEQRGPASIDFGAEVWPAIARDAYDAFYRTVARVDPGAITTSLDELIAAIDDAAHPDELPRAVAPHLIDSDRVLDHTRWAHPLAGVHETIDELTGHIAASMANDIRHAVLARESPLKNALWEISAARKPSQILGAEGRFTFDSRRGEFAAMMAFGQMVGSGPPLFRTSQLLALVDAGLAHFVGARPSVLVRDGAWEVRSPTTGDTPLRARTLVDAWMHSPDIRRPGDPLSRSLLAAERARPFTLLGPDGEPAPSASPEVDATTRRLIRTDGTLDPRIHMLGIPTHAQHPDTTISPMPGTDPLMLRETDAAAVDVLAQLGLR